MMGHFRTRFAQGDYDKINAEIIPCGTNTTAKSDTGGEGEGETVAGTDESQAQQAPSPDSNTGKLLIDASVTPADITYPTDLKLRNAAREKAEHLIDLLHQPFVGRRRKPRSYRKEARKDFLGTIKLKRPRAKKMRRALGRQLRYLKRDLRHLDELVQAGADLGRLRVYDYRCLLVIHEIYRQQLEMWREKKHRVADRIVSLSQPWVRPIVRGKAGVYVEFGAKISIGVVNGYVTLHRMQWGAYNENADLPQQAEVFRETYGHYPESVHADQIYRTRANRAWCKARGIRSSGSALGRPPKDSEANTQRLAAAKAQMRADELARIPVEGKFGNAKRGGSLSRVMAKLTGTSVSVVNIAMIVLNLGTRLRELFCRLLEWLPRQAHYAYAESGTGGPVSRVSANTAHRPSITDR